MRRRPESIRIRPLHTQSPRRTEACETTPLSHVRLDRAPAILRYASAWWRYVLPAWLTRPGAALCPLVAGRAESVKPKARTIQHDCADSGLPVRRAPCTTSCGSGRPSSQSGPCRLHVQRGQARHERNPAVVAPLSYSNGPSWLRSQARITASSSSFPVGSLVGSSGEPASSSSVTVRT
jgi:hypothetical protein